MKQKFQHAFRGLIDGFNDPSIRLQMILGCLALAAAVIMRLDSTEWLAGLICAGLVITAEILNTCIEKLCDLYSVNENEKIRVIKDLGAAAVLIASLTALIAGVIILFRHWR